MLWTLDAREFPLKKGIMHSAVQHGIFLLAAQMIKTATQGLLHDPTLNDSVGRRDSKADAEGVSLPGTNY